VWRLINGSERRFCAWHAPYKGVSEPTSKPLTVACRRSHRTRRAWGHEESEFAARPGKVDPHQGVTYRTEAAKDDHGGSSSTVVGQRVQRDLLEIDASNVSRVPRRHAPVFGVEGGQCDAT
jgi:hypothetical protein